MSSDSIQPLSSPSYTSSYLEVAARGYSYAASLISAAWQRTQEAYDYMTRPTIRVVKVEDYQEFTRTIQIGEWAVIADRKMRYAETLWTSNCFSVEQFSSCYEVCREITVGLLMCDTIMTFPDGNQKGIKLTEIDTAETRSQKPSIYIFVDRLPYFPKQIEFFFCKGVKNQVLGAMVTVTDVDSVQIRYVVTHPNHLDSPLNVVIEKVSGVGRCLVQYAEQMARRMDKRKVRVHYPRFSSVDFFLKMGFQNIGTPKIPILEKEISSDPKTDSQAPS